jgi:hypothetical protein
VHTKELVDPFFGSSRNSLLEGERLCLGGESSQSRASAGSTCLSVVKVPPDYAAYIPPILGGHPVTASAAKPFFPERKTSERERESGHSPRDDHTETVLGLPRCCTLQDMCPKLLAGTYMRVY